jgi:predicted RND superfamily exporter protein
VIDWLFRHRRLSWGAAVAVTLAAGSFLPRLRFDNSLEVWFLDDDPALVSYQHFLDLFDSDEVIVAAWRDSDLLTPAGLGRVEEVSALIEAHEDVLEVLSLTRAEEIRGYGDGIAVGKAIEPGRAVDGASLLRNPAVGGLLLSPDQQATAVVARVVHRPGQIDYKFALVKAIRAQLAVFSARTGLGTHLAGAPVFDDAFFRYTNRDTMVLMPLMLVFIVVVMWLIFRSMRALLYPLAIVVPAQVIVLGVLAAAGARLTVIHTIIAPLLLATGIADAVHLLVHYQTLRGEGLEPAAAALRSLKALWRPCLATSGTTALGLLSLLTADLGPLREFGAAGALGVLVAFVYTFLVAPVLLPRVPVTSGLVFPVARLAPWVNRRVGPILIASAAIGIATMAGVARLDVSNNSLEYFKKNDTVYKDTLAIDREFGGAFGAEVLLSTPEPGQLQEPALLRKMQETATFLDALPGFSRARSLVDVVREVDRALVGNDPGQLPAERAAVAQYLLLVEGDADLGDLVDPDYTHGRVTARVRATTADHATENAKALRRHLAQTYTGTSVKAQSTGLIELMYNVETYLLSSQIRSFALAFVLVIAAMMVALRSVKLGLLSAIPNLLPIGMTLGIMGFLGIRLDAGTVMIAPVALGLVVDDTVHFLHHVRAKMDAGASVASAIEHTMRVAGSPIVATSIILMAGFWTLTAASFRPNIFYGLLSGIAILLALLCDLLLLPALLRRMYRRA